MAFKKIRQSNISAENPEALFWDLRNRKVEGPLSHQADILREYYKLRESDKKGIVKNSDVAIQLPTGSGKTLVALLIGEWNRRYYNYRVVYLCPTRQLVNQVVEQALSKYGIKANAFVGGRTDYSPTIIAEYTNAETLAVTTYSSLFNINPFFDNADIIIFDDAHASENYIAEHWSLVIERNKTKHQALFKAMVAAIRELIPNEHYTRIFGDYQDFRDTQWVEKIPTPYFYKRLPEIRAILDEHIQGDNDLKYLASLYIHRKNFYNIIS